MLLLVGPVLFDSVKSAADVLWQTHTHTHTVGNVFAFGMAFYQCTILGIVFHSSTN